MATVGNAALNLLRIHGVTNIAAERRRLNGSDREILKRMGLSTETANSFYSVLPATPSNTFTQSFDVSTAAPTIRKQGKPRPGLIMPRA